MKNFLSFLMGAVLVAGSSSVLHAQSFTWDPSATGTGSDGSGTWTASSSTTNWSSGGSTVSWPNTTSDTAVIGAATGSGGTITVNGTVNAAGLVFNTTFAGGYNLIGGTINGSGIFDINVANGSFFPFGQFFSTAFTGASSYDFIGASSPGNGNGLDVNGNTTFDNNVVLGTGSDSGELLWSDANALNSSVTGHTVTVNSNWSIAEGYSDSDNLVLNGMGTRGNGTIAFLGSGAILSGSISLTHDAAINSDPNNNATNYVTGNISGNSNLFLGYWDPSGSNVNLQISGSNSYTGATMIMNSTGANNANGAPTGTDPHSPTNEAIQLGSNHALPSTTTLVIGVNTFDSPIAGVASFFSQDSGASGGESDGALDMNGYNATVAGLTTGGGVTNTGNNFIGNNSGSNVSTLTISGTGNYTFGGTIEDNFGNAGGQVGITLSAGTETLSGTNTYTGGTTVTGGTLIAGVAGGSSSGPFGGSTGAMSVSGSGTLNLNNFSQTVGALTLGNSGGATNTANIKFGTNTTTTLTASGLTWNGGGSTLSFNLDTASNAGNLLNLNSGAFTMAGSGAYDINITGGDNGQDYDLINFGSTTFTSGSQFTETGSGVTGVFVLTGSNLQFDAGSVPEPSTWALLILALSGLGFHLWRQRRSGASASS